MIVFFHRVFSYSVVVLWAEEAGKTPTQTLDAVK
jgi:hypothetical protein